MNFALLKTLSLQKLKEKNMNKEILKAIEDKQKKHPFREWWGRNNYKVFRIILFPIWIYIEVSDRIKAWNYKRTTWDEKRANEILNYYIPRESDWDPENKTFYNGMGWNLSLAKRNLKRKDYRFWKRFNGFFGGEIREYLVKSFELEGFEKEVLNNSDWTEIIFKQKS